MENMDEYHVARRELMTVVSGGQISGKELKQAQK